MLAEGDGGDGGDDNGGGGRVGDACDGYGSGDSYYSVTYFLSSETSPVLAEGVDGGDNGVGVGCGGGCWWCW